MPQGSLTAYNGKLYGMTIIGGINQTGVIFEFDPTITTYTKKYDFDSFNGNNPFGNLSFYQGKFYGMTSAGGANNMGVIFEWDPATNIYIKKYDFDAVNGGSKNFLIHNGKFYGMANGIFEWDPATN